MGRLPSCPSAFARAWFQLPFSGQHVCVQSAVTSAGCPRGRPLRRGDSLAFLCVCALSHPQARSQALGRSGESRPGVWGGRGAQALE